MTVLGLVLIVKIIVTVFGVVLPFLAFSPEFVERLTGWRVEPVLLRLYGIAIAALLVGYGYGLMEVLGGWYPDGTVMMGLVSNGGATAALLALGQGWVRAAGAATFGAITVALAACFLDPTLAMSEI